VSNDSAAAKSGGGSSTDGKDAGAFVGVRRRRPPARNTAMAATLVAAAEEVADAGFLGTVSDGAAATPPTTLQSIGVAPSKPSNTSSPSTPTPGASEEAEQAPAVINPTATDGTPDIPSARGERPVADPPVPQATSTDDKADATAEGAELTAADSATATAAAPAVELNAGVQTGESEGQDAAETDRDAQGSVGEHREAEKKTTKSAAKQRKPLKSSSKQGPTLLDLQASFADSRTNSKQWATHGANMVPEVWDALRSRIAQDRRSAGNPELAAGHYMDVVFRNAPMDADALIDLYQKLSDQRMGYLGSGKKSTFRLGPIARANASEMKALLDEADYARKGLYVVSALVVQLLRKLDEEGSLLRPELPPLL
jgi:hypothetical protein